MKRSGIKRMQQTVVEDEAIREDDDNKRMKMKKESQFKSKNKESEDLNEFLSIAAELDKLREE